MKCRYIRQSLFIFSLFFSFQAFAWNAHNTNDHNRYGDKYNQNEIYNSDFSVNKMHEGSRIHNSHHKHHKHHNCKKHCNHFDKDRDIVIKKRKCHPRDDYKTEYRNGKVIITICR